MAKKYIFADSCYNLTNPPKDVTVLEFDTETNTLGIYNNNKAAATIPVKAESDNDNKFDITNIPTKLSELQNDKKFITLKDIPTGISIDTVKEIVKSYINDYSAFEVFPTDKVIPAGTLDDQEHIGKLFNIENYKGTIIDNNTAVYTKEVPIQMGCCFDVRSLSKNHGLITIDWGDGNINTSADNSEFITRSEDEAGYKYLFSHEYNKAGKYIVKIYGDCYQIRSYGGKYTNSIVSRAFDADLPIGKNIRNLSSGCAKNYRLLAINVPDYYECNVTNIVSLFSQCYNLLDVKIGKYNFFIHNSFVATGRVFNCCVSLKHSDFRLPTNCQNMSPGDSYEAFYLGCSSLEMELKDLLPGRGFTKATMLVSTFGDCKKLIINADTINDPIAQGCLSIPEILWNSTQNKFILTQTTFANCPQFKGIVPSTWTK